MWYITVSQIAAGFFFAIILGALLRLVQLFLISRLVCVLFDVKMLACTIKRTAC